MGSSADSVAGEVRGVEPSAVICRSCGPQSLSTRPWIGATSPGFWGLTALGSVLTKVVCGVGTQGTTTQFFNSLVNWYEASAPESGHRWKFTSRRPGVQRTLAQPTLKVSLSGAEMPNLLLFSRWIGRLASRPVQFPSACYV